MTRGLLLDTHALLWATLNPNRLGRAARLALEAREVPVFVSAVSALEIATKYRIGKLPEAEALARDFRGETASDGFICLDLTVDHGQRGGSLSIPHKDPFDRLLIAQAQIEQLTLISNEKLFDQFGVIRLW